MKALDRRVLLAFVLATLSGTLLHFVHDFFPNTLTALFAPVNESIWEHLKLVYWPYLIAVLLLTRGEGSKGRRGPWLLSLLTVCAVMLGVGYFYHVTLRGDSRVFDIGFYVVLMGAAFLLPRLFWRLSEQRVLNDALWFTVVLLGASTFLFTFYPPEGLLFVDGRALHTWVTIPW